MSAWIVDREHIDLLVSFGRYGHNPRHAGDGRAARWIVQNPDEKPWQECESRDIRQPVEIDGETLTGCDYAGRLLWIENLTSVAYRYPDDYSGGRPGMVGPDEEILSYTHTHQGYMLTPLEAIHACDCLEYQSCEHPGWKTSEARRCLTAIRELAIDALEGERGPWGWDAGKVAERRGVTA